MKVFLIIATLINGSLSVKAVFPVQNSSCEEVCTSIVVQQSWKEVFGENTVFYCVEEL